MTQKAIFSSKWIDIQDMPSRYNIKMDDLISAIEELNIETRGKIYDEISQYMDGSYVLIAPTSWNEMYFDEWNEATGIDKHFLSKSLEHENAYEGDGYYRTGYVDIQINIEDFNNKVTIKIKKSPTGQRIHAQTQYFAKLYAKAKKRLALPKLGAEEFLDYLENLHSTDNSVGGEFEIEVIKKGLKRDWIIEYSIAEEGVEKENRLKFSRFSNIVSELNSGKRKIPD